MSDSLIFALASAIAALLYGAISIKWVLSKPTGSDRMREIAAAIQEGASAYLNRQYTTIGVVGVILFLVIYFMLDPRTAIGFAIGAVLSAATGYIGMNISVRANVRTTEAAKSGLNPALQVAFRAGAITGLRFYKGAGNTGTHTGSLWTTTGQRLATATFTNETASGWQQIDFAAPVVISANTTYIASYYAPNGNYAYDLGYFASADTVTTPLRALRDGADGPNAVYKYGGGFPTDSNQASNYWVDVVFVLPDTTPPTVTSTSPASGTTGVATTSPVTATFSEAMDPASISNSTFELRDAANALVPASVSYNTTTRKATLQSTNVLASNTSYTARVRGGSSGATDAFGNALAADSTWSFTTGSGPACPCRLWGADATPGQASVGESATIELGMKFRSDYSGYITLVICFFILFKFARWLGWKN